MLKIWSIAPPLGTRDLDTLVSNILKYPKSIQSDSDVFNIKQNLNRLHQGEHRFSYAFFAYTEKNNFRNTNDTMSLSRFN